MRVSLFASAMLLLLAVASVGLAQEIQRVDLLGDAGFSRGATIWRPAPGKKVEGGRLRINDQDAAEPIWGVAQWHSRFDLADARREAIDGNPTWFDGAKRVTFVLDGGDVTAVRFGLDGVREFEDRYRASGDPWPHLLAEQRFQSHPTLDKAAAVPFHVRFRLLESRRTTTTPERWSDRVHTGHFQCFLTVQNLNPRSPGKGDYLWFGVPLYDARWPIPRPHMAKDRGSERKQGTGKFIYTPGGDAYTARSAWDGEPIEIDVDLLPMIRDALAMAWDRGYLQDSRELSDYALGGMNIGWEVSGPIDVEAEFGDLSVAVELKP